MKLLVVLVLSWMGMAQAPLPQTCLDNPKKGACLFFEDKSPLSQELPKDLSFSSFYKIAIRTSLSHRSLRGADLQEVRFLNNKAIKSDFTSANLKGFQGTGSDFFKGVFNRADLRGAKLFYANFKEADLQKASLVNADLSFVDFSKADLRGANLQEAWVLGALFEGARYDEHTILPFSQQRARQLGMIFDGKVLEKTH